MDAVTVAVLYKNKWVIEVFFKQIERNFELKYFLSDSSNGIKIQIWMALIFNLLFTVLHKRIKEAEDFSTMVMVASKNLCSSVSLEKFQLYTEAYFKSIF
ncbi:transposase [Belliella aquatica]|uniref:transposase n=1 Tax=Belliella aquatica TaxID=1323734 RepID=UPI0016680890